MKINESLQGFYQRIDCKKLSIETSKPHINVFERSSCGTLIPFSRRDYFKVTLLIGKGRIEYADKVYEIAQPTLMFSNPLIPYAWIPKSAKQEGWFCIFNEAFVKQRDQLLTSLPMFQIDGNHLFTLNKEQEEKISDFFIAMMQENRNCYELKSDILRSYLHLIVHEALKMTPIGAIEKTSNASVRITNLFLELLERQFPVDSIQNSLKLHSANDFAKNLSVHVNHLNRSVKEITGKTTSEHISNRITLEAQALIRHSDWAISEIAYSLGFEYPAHFTSFYKRKTGISPTSLRK